MSTSTEFEIQKKPIKRIVLSVVFGIVFVLAVALISISVWYKNNYFMEFAALLEVLNGPIEGTGANMIHDICWAVIPSDMVFFTGMGHSAEAAMTRSHTSASRLQFIIKTPPSAHSMQTEVFWVNSH